MSTATPVKEQAQQRVLEYVTEKGEATVDGVAAGMGISRTSARKHLIGLESSRKLKREPGGREGRRRLPDRFSPLSERRRSAPRSKKGSRQRLRPGQLDGLVLAYLRQHEADGALTATAVAKGLGGRSTGAVANCLQRLAKAKQVRLAKRTPRAYDLKGIKAR